MNCCKDQQKLHSYEMLSKLNKEDFNAFFDFGKEGIFHIVFESIITVYLLELLATLSKFFLIDPTNLPNPILYVFLPSIMIIPIAIIFTLLHIYRFIRISYDYSCLSTEDQVDCLLKKEGKLYNKLLLIHVWGVMFYLFTSLVISLLLQKKYSANIINGDLFSLVLPLIGFIFGVVWNATGFYRDLRFFLARLLSKCKNDNGENRKKLYIYTKYNIIGNGFSLFLLFVASAIILMNINEKILSMNMLKEIITNYSFIVIFFVTIIAFYVRKGVLLLYPQFSKENDIFPSINYILGKENDYMKQQKPPH